MTWNRYPLAAGKLAFDFHPYLHWLIYPEVTNSAEKNAGSGSWDFPVVLENSKGELEVMVFGSADRGQVSGRGRGGPIPNKPRPGGSKPPRIPAELGKLPKVILAVIDIDIAFANARFRREDDPARTRIAWFWDQGADSDPRSGPQIGREMFAPTIEGLLQAAGGNEAALYSGYWSTTRAGPERRPTPPALAHGTHVLDTASWGLPADDVALFAVELPALIVKGTHGAFLFPYVQLAIERIVQVAQAWAETENAKETPRIVVNFSFGSFAGRHDGQTRFERFLDKQIDDGKIAAICVPAGNSYDSRTHARLSEAGGVVWRIQPGDGTPSFLQIWLPRTVEQGIRMELAVTTPWGATYHIGDLSPGLHELTASGKVLARAYAETNGTDSDNARTCITLAVGHTDRFAIPLGREPGRPELAGDWQVEVTKIEGLKESEEVCLWVERDDVIRGTRTGARQSYLREASPRGTAPQREDQRGNRDANGRKEVVRYDGTINDFGTGRKTVVVAGHRRSDSQRVRYCSLGARLNGQPRFPTVSAVCEESPGLHGVLAAGWSSGSVRAMGGTSVATAVVSREIVRALLKQTVATVQVPSDKAQAKDGAGHIQAEVPVIGRLRAWPRLSTSRRPSSATQVESRPDEDPLDTFLAKAGRPVK